MDYAKLTLKKIQKRDGRVVEFEPEHIERAISLAVAESKEFDEKETKRLTDIVVGILEKVYDGKLTPTVEQIQDVVEQVLMAAGHYDTARRYIIYRDQKNKEREVKKIIGVTDDLGLPLNSLKVLENRFLMHDSRGNVVETPKQMFMRVAGVLAGVEKKKKYWTEKFFEVMSKLEFLPAGRTLNNAGTPQNQLANCFVLPIEDSMEKIFEAVKWTAIVHQKGGGTGFDFSKLRPKGDVVTKSSGGFATGPVSFMKVFDTATRQVMQGGKKRGANMGILNVDHPDILEFITCKELEGEISNFNISVGVTDKFMEAVVADKNYELVNPRNGEVVKRLSARTVFDQITALAWRTGDPGMIFLDAINRNNPLLEKYGRIDATNPCGEQPLYPFDACNLGSINLAKFVAHQSVHDSKEINWKRLEEVVRVAVRMLDNVIDACNYPLPQITETVRQNRRIGLGVMGWADMLYQLGVSYNSDSGIRLAEKVAKFIQDKSWEASEEIAAEKGVFPRWEESSFFKKKKKVRNLSITTIAPTGSISMAADCSSGIEPVFALSYTKNVVSDLGLYYTNKYFEKAIEGLDRDTVLKEVAKKGSTAGVYGVPRELQKTFVVSYDIAPEWHVKMQSAWQKYTDNAVSKTINFPFEATIDDVEKAYIMAWKSGCKGITVYRDRSKDVQILMKSSSNENGNNGGGYIIQSKIKTKPLEEEDEKCSDCGGKMVFEEGCSKCKSCGYSYCKG